MINHPKKIFVCIFKTHEIRQKMSCVSLLLLFVGLASAQTVLGSGGCTWKYGSLSTETDSDQWCKCNAGYTGRYFLADFVPTTFCSRFLALMVKEVSFQSVSTRNHVAVGSSSRPTYVSSGGPSGNGHVQFDSVSNQYLDAGLRTFRPEFSSYPGFTIMTIVRFTGTAQSTTETIFQIPGHMSLVIVSRNSIQCILYKNGATIATASRTITADTTTWREIICLYRHSLISANLDLRVGISRGTATATQLLNENTVNNMHIGAPGVGTSFNGDMAGLFFVDEWLGTSGLSSVYDPMKSGVDLTDTTCPFGEKCSTCTPGKYKSITGTSACLNCPVNTPFSPVASLASTACIVVTDCPPGYTGPSGGPCTACVAGTYKDNAGTATCIPCPAGTISPAASTSSAACIVEVCKVGNTGPIGGPCTPCAAGSYKDTTGSAPCTACGVGQYSIVVASASSMPCLACLANTASPAGSSSFAACVTVTDCWAGHTGPYGGPCTACVAGTYKSVTGSATCTACPAGTTSQVASTSSAACIVADCNAGYTGPSGGPCAACVAGKYKDVTGSTACTDCGSGKYSTTTAATVATTCLACPADTTSPTASTSSAACISTACNPGYTGPDGICSTCAAGTYKVGTGSAACMACVAGTYSTIPAATAETACLACPTNSNSPSQSSADTSCTCNIGYFGPPGGVCAPCAAGSYKDDTVSVSCTSCPAFSSSAPASKSIDFCVCGPGHFDASV